MRGMVVCVSCVCGLWCLVVSGGLDGEARVGGCGAVLFVALNIQWLGVAHFT